MRIQMSDFWQVRYSNTVAIRGIVLSWFPVLRMHKQISDFWQVRYSSTVAKRPSYEHNSGHAQTSFRFHQNGASSRYSWKLILGPAQAQTNVRFLTGEIRYDSKKRRSLELNSCPAHVQKISGLDQNGLSRRYSWKLIFGPAHAHTDVRFLTGKIQ